MKALGVIPARYKSSRFPGKALVEINGKPLIICVTEIAVEALGKENVIVATEDKRILDVVKKWGFKGIMTSDKCLTGTDRLWEVAQEIHADMYINIQGDEPMVLPSDIVKIVNARLENPSQIVNGYHPIAADEDPHSVNIPKVIFDENKRLIYMSRLALPGVKGGDLPNVYFKQVCIYAFTYAELEAFGNKGAKTYLEAYEDIEILRFLEMGYTVKMVKTSSVSLAVDVPEDVQIVENAMKATTTNRNERD